jgi:hypothetical protein
MNKEDKPTALHTSGKYQQTRAYNVGFIVEMFVERKVRAFDEEQAKELAENRFRAKHQSFIRKGYTAGDIEQITCELVK